MKLLLDTSVLVAAMVEKHPAHSAAYPWLKRIKEGVDAGVVAAHTIAELYAVLSVLPLQPRLSPEMTRQLIEHNVLSVCEVLIASKEDYITVVNRLANLGLSGGVIYDALILQVGLNADVDLALTLNPKDFRRVYPEFAAKIVLP